MLSAFPGLLDFRPINSSAQKGVRNNAGNTMLGATNAKLMQKESTMLRSYGVLFIESWVGHWMYLLQSPSYFLKL